MQCVYDVVWLLLYGGSHALRAPSSFQYLAHPVHIATQLRHVAGEEAGVALQAAELTAVAQRDGDAATALRAGPGTPLTIKRRSQ